MFFEKKEKKKIMIKLDMDCPECGEKKVFKFDKKELDHLECFCINCGWSAKNYDWNKPSIFS